MRTISLKLPEDLLTDLADEARVRKVTKSSLVREGLALLLYPKVSDVQCCYEVAHELAGAVKGLPKDLADNPKYMDGFGQ